MGIVNCMLQSESYKLCVVNCELSTLCYKVCVVICVMNTMYKIILLRNIWGVS